MNLAILGTRGIPAGHGGFETFAEKLALHLVGKGWRVTVYCQVDGKGPIHQDVWQGVDRVLIPVSRQGAMGTIMFDALSIKHLLKSGSKLALTLGYNTALFCTVLRIKRIVNLMNMDGLEWKRQKWSWWQRLWLRLNERVGCHVANHLIADHPMIERHLVSFVHPDKVTMIPYGADEFAVQHLDLNELYGLTPRKYVLLVARPEPENSVLELVRAFSSEERSVKMVVLGKYDPDNEYHSLVMRSASKEVVFLGGVYNKEHLFALRKEAVLYVHGHQVGGTNPSLVEALAAGSAVMAHDNVFNRWVAGEESTYFKTEADCRALFSILLNDDIKLEAMRNASLCNFIKKFTWREVLNQYEILLNNWCQM